MSSRILVASNFLLILNLERGERHCYNILLGFIFIMLLLDRNSLLIKLRNDWLRIWKWLAAFNIFHISNLFFFFIQRWKFFSFLSKDRLFYTHIKLTNFVNFCWSFLWNRLPFLSTTLSNSSFHLAIYNTPLKLPPIIVRKISRLVQVVHQSCLLSVYSSADVSSCG